MKKRILSLLLALSLEIDERQFFQVHECVFSSMPV